ncbi:MAG: ACP S-malonyltransferase [Clostridium sp.]|nr:ACP S-malonyltransferase [Clostridium sp.]
MKNLALLFPGQGSQYTGMGRNLLDNFQIARDTFDEASEILGLDLTNLCLHGSSKELTQTKNAQIAIFITGVSAFRVYMSEVGIKPSTLLGHSLGEITALTCSGAINFKDAVKIVKSRGELMQEAGNHNEGIMLAVKDVDRNILADKCKEISENEKVVVIANYNASNQLVVSGYSDSVAKVKEFVEKEQGKAIYIKVSGAFHSPLMYDAAQKFREELCKYKYNKLRYSVISNVTARPYTSESEIVDNLSKQIFSPILWEDSMKQLDEIGVNIGIDLGPQKVISSLIKKNNVNITPISIEEISDLSDISKSIYMNRRDLIFVNESLGVIVSTENCNKNYSLEEYNTQVVEAYNNIVSIRNSIEESVNEENIENVKKVMDITKNILKYKNIDINEQKERLERVIVDSKLRELNLNLE